MLTVLSILLLLYSVFAILSQFELKSGDDRYPNLPFGKIALGLSIGLFIFSQLLVKIGPQDVGVQITPTGVSEKILSTGGI